jgi:hypothetical protein
MLEAMRQPSSAPDREADPQETGRGTAARTPPEGDVGGNGAGQDCAGADPIEVWGRRIGRALSAVGVVVLTWWLGRQLHWW